MILVNLLIIIMLALAILSVMIVGDEADVDRSSRMRWSDQAMAIARGAESSAVTALRRDLVKAPDSDSLDEPWANIADANVAIANGRFSFAVVDAQGKFNVNNLASGDATALAAFTQIATAAGVPLAKVDAVVRLLRDQGMVGDVAQLALAGLTADEIARIAPLTVALPERTEINANTAPEALIAVLTGSAATARTIAAQRQRPGGLSGGGALQGVSLPPGVGFRSNWFWARADVLAGGTRQQLSTLLDRRMVDGQPRVDAVRRWRGTPPLMAPPLPPVPAA